MSFLGKFQNSKVVFVQELPKGRLLSVEEDGHVNLWDLGTGKVLNSEVLKFQPTTCCLHAENRFLVIGSKQGSVRVMQLGTEGGKDMLEVGALKFGENSPVTSIKIDENIGMLAVKFASSNKVYFCKFNEEKRCIESYGFLPFEITISDFDWTPEHMERGVMVLLQGGILLTVPLVFNPTADKEELSNLTDCFSRAQIRKVDSDSERMFQSKSDNTLLLYGETLVLRKYKYPIEQLSKVDHKVKIPPPPIEEYIAFELFPQNAIATEKRFYFTTENGEIGAYDFETQTISCRSLFSFERGACSFMHKTQEGALIAGGADGSLFVVSQIDAFLSETLTQRTTFYAEKQPIFDQEMIEFVPQMPQNRSSPVENRKRNRASNVHFDSTDPEQLLQVSSDSAEGSRQRGSKRKSVKPDALQSNDNTDEKPNQNTPRKEKRISIRRALGIAFKEVDLDELPHSEIVTACLSHLSEAEVPNIYDLLFKAHLEAIESEKELNHKTVLRILKEHQEEYARLKELNEQLDADHKLSPDELCIDVEKQQAYKSLAEEVTEEVRFRAKKEVAYYDILYSKLKQNTFQKMDVHIKGMTAFIDKVGIFNFPISKALPGETKVIAKVSLLRRMEMREREWHLENNPDAESVDIPKPFMVEDQPEFLVDGGVGKQRMVLTDFEQREKELKDYEEEKRKKKEKLQNANNKSVSRRIELVNRRRRKKKNAKQTFNKQGAEHKQNMPESQEPQSKLSRMSSREMQKQIQQLCSTLELTTPTKKVMQMVFIKQYIRHIKEEFNQDFEAMYKIREKKLDIIAELNKKIREICAELQIPDESIQVTSNIIEK